MSASIPAASSTRLPWPSTPPVAKLNCGRICGLRGRFGLSIGNRHSSPARRRTLNLPQTKGAFRRGREVRDCEQTQVETVHREFPGENCEVVSRRGSRSSFYRYRRTIQSRQQSMFRSTTACTSVCQWLRPCQRGTSGSVPLLPLPTRPSTINCPSASILTSPTDIRKVIHAPFPPSPRSAEGSIRRALGVWPGSIRPDHRP